MGDFSRRSFMQMLGLSGMALATGPLPLFGSDEIKTLIEPPKANLLRGHVVVQKKGLTELIPPEERAKMSHRYGTPVARLTKSQVPGGGKFSGLREYRLVSKGAFPEGVDPHVVYYKASNDLRDQFQAQSRKRLMGVPAELRAGAVLVT